MLDNTWTLGGGKSIFECLQPYFLLNKIVQVTFISLVQEALNFNSKIRLHKFM